MASIAFGLCCLGCLLLSLSLRRHYRQVFADESLHAQRRWMMRWTGYGILAFGLWPSARESGFWIGVILWLSLIALAAFLQIMLLTYRPRSSALMGGIGLALIVAGLLP